MSDSSDTITSSGSDLSDSEDDFLPEFQNTDNNNSLMPYQFEPVVSSSDVGSSATDELVSVRKGNTSWCTCGMCKVMETELESLCCQEEVPSDYFEGKQCITEKENLEIVCLHKEVLKTTLAALNYFQGNVIEFTNQAFRYAGYRQYTWWVHNRLGQGVRKVIPSCVIWKIRDKYPDNDNIYVSFQEANHDLYM